MVDARVGLVIEDDHDIRELVRTVLTHAGFDVTVASSGAEGVLFAKDLNPDVITLDLGLPESLSGETSADDAHAERGSFSHNGLVLSYASRTVVVDGNEMNLTRTEFELLYALLEAGRTVRTKSDLVRRLRDEDYDVGSYISEADERSVEVHMGNLRKKLGDSPQKPRWLQTVRGVGYRLAPEH